MKDHAARLFPAIVLGSALVAVPAPALAQVDPGPRGGAAGAGGQVAGLTVKEGKYFAAGLDSFTEVASVTGSVPGTEEGLGPRFNLNSCAGCHAHPSVGGSSPAANPQVLGGVAHQSQIDLLLSLNIISANGPVREVRFVPDGGVHALFTIMGLPGTPAGCSLAQPDFAVAHAGGRLRFRVPTPVFGAGLIEAIEDSAIEALAAAAKPFGITGHANRNGNDGTITRFGWKAQNKSLTIFSGEAYNVEQGITNNMFPDERGEGGVQDSPACRQIVPAPQDIMQFEQTQPQRVPDDANQFANFMRFLAPPAQVTSYDGVTNAQIVAGEAAFDKAGCSVCHVKAISTGYHMNVALRFKVARLFSDLLVHDVGTGDDIAQGAATGAEFRTAPLWGAGQRLFFMHDGSATDLVAAINAHAGEATEVIRNYNGASGASAPLDATERLNLLRFLRSL